MTGYVRQSSADIVPTGVVRAAPINNELNQLRDAFSSDGGHKHDGSLDEGAYVPLIADVEGINKVEANIADNSIDVSVNVSGVAVKQVSVVDGAIVPTTDDDVDLGSPTKEFKNLYIDGIANIDSLVADTADVNGGTIDATTIGASTPSAGSFTTLTTSAQAALATVNIDGGNIDGTAIGATTPSTGVFTTVSASGGVTANLTGNVTGNVTGNLTGNVVGAVTGSLSGNVTATTGTSTFNDVTITGGLNMDAGTTATITNLTSPTNTNDAATKGYVDTSAALKLNLSGGTMSGAIAMGANKITGLGTPTIGTDAATKDYVDVSVSNLVDAAPGALNTLNELAAALGDDANFSTTVTNALATKLALTGGTMSGAIAMSGNKITGLGTPTATTDAVTKTYVDSANATKLSLAGGTMSGILSLGTYKITSVGNPTSAQDAATKSYVDSADSAKLSLTGGTMVGSINMSGYPIISTYYPISGSDLTNKNYVDSILGSATSAATSAAAAAVSATNAATSATNAANSATAAASSATDAASAYTSLSSLYLGAHASAPTTTNVGALYWDTVQTDLYVWSGTAWVQGSLNVDDLGGSSLIVSETEPVAPADGTTWLDLTTGNIYIYFNDGDSSQWVEFFAANATTTGGGGTSTELAMGNFVTAGDAISKEYVLRAETTGTTGVDFVYNVSDAIPITANSTMQYTVDVVARRTDGTQAGAGWTIKGVADNYSGTSANVLNLYETVIASEDVNLSVDITADDTTDTLKITAYGSTGATYRWVAYVRTVEVAQ